jgi:ATP dependent DNA ligase domain
MPLLSRPLPFDDANWLFELKYDGFRALAVMQNGNAQLVSRNGHRFASFADLAMHIAAGVPSKQITVLDGEIVCVDKKGRPQFRAPNKSTVLTLQIARTAPGSRSVIGNILKWRAVRTCLSVNDTRNQLQAGILACWLVPKKRAERYEPLRSYWGSQPVRCRGISLHADRE